jgi:hypothetical protein
LNKVDGKNKNENPSGNDRTICVLPHNDPLLSPCDFGDNIGIMFSLNMSDNIKAMQDK